jgi:hypothetical protein
MEDKELARLKEIYDVYRSARLNEKYYGYQTYILTRFNFGLEVFTAVFAASGIAGWAIWQYSAGAIVWQICSGIAALAAILKPIINLGPKIEKSSTLAASHRGDFLSLRRLCTQIKRERSITADINNRFETILEHHDKLAAEDPMFPNRRLITRFQNEVLAEIPIGSLWSPNT